MITLLRQLLRAPLGAANATRLVFFLTGFSFSVWSAIIPFMRASLGIDEAALGLLVLCLGTGSLLLMPLSGKLVSRWGVRRVLTTVMPAGMLMLPALSVVSNYWAAAGCILVMGALLGTADVSMNIQSVVVEKAEKRPMLSGFHATYSLGGLLGAGLVGLQLAVGIPIAVAVGLLYVISLALLLRALPSCLAKEEEAADDPHTDAPRRGIPLYIWALGAFCFIMFLTEGSVMDWSGVYLRDVAAADAASASLGFAVFSAFQTVGRLAGNRLISRFGRPPVLLCGCALCSAALVALACGIPAWAAFAAYGTLGLATANIIPIFLWAAGNQKLMPVAAAMSTVATCGYLGILAGPAGIGVIAEHWSVCTAYAVVACLTALVAANFRRVR